MGTGKCANCGRRRVTERVQRFGGGTFRRAGRWYDTQVCAECAEALLTYAGPGQRQVSRFAVAGLRLALQRLTAP